MANIISSQQLMSALRDMGIADDGPAKPKIDPDIRARVMSDMLPLLNRVNPFKVGDVVQLQKGRSVYKFPDEATHYMGIVTQILDKQPEFTNVSKAAAWHRNDMVILAEAEGDWVELIVDSWRFEKYDGEIA